MEIGKRINPGYIFRGLYLVAFIIYLIVGLQPAEAVNSIISSKLIIPSIELESDVTTLVLEDHGLNTPDKIVGSYAPNENKTLLIGHSSTVFSNLDKVQIGDTLVYDDSEFVVTDFEVLAKDEIFMTDLLASTENETVVIMTCAGENLENGDATHRLIVYTEKI